jgi:hypothetical protein
MTALAIILSLAGGACELTGLTLVVREILSDRQRARRLLARLDAPRRPQRTYPGPMTAPPFPRPEYMSGLYGPRQQLEGVAKHIERNQAEVGNALVKLKKLTDQELDQAVERIQRDVAVRDAEVREGLRYLLAGSTRERTLGATLLALGIVLAAAGSVVGAST